MPLQESSSSTTIKLRFKTHRPHGLLLLAAGLPDYCVLELKSGIVHVHFDLGSGSASLHSQPNQRLDDHHWHDIQFIRRNNTATLTIDKSSNTSVQATGNFLSLNINQGIFLGGTGSYQHVPITIRNFRGCMEKVFYNKINIVRKARRLKDPLNVFEISWSCDREFDADTDQPITLLSDSSFVAFPHLRIRQKGEITFDFRTRTQTGLLLFNEGRPLSPDFVALEIINSKIKLSLNKGNGIIELFSDTEVTDGKWHSVILRIRQETVILRVDGQENSTHSNLGNQKFINLGGHLFIGGLRLKTRIHAIKRGLLSLKDVNSAGSIQGCFRDIFIDSRQFGFRDIQISREIDPSCLWQYPCASNPCVEDAECEEIGFDNFECTCPSDNCLKPVVTSPSPSPNINDKFNFVAIQKLVVEEETEKTITSSNIDIKFDYQKYNIRESAILFTILIPPRHGTIENLSSKERRSTFTQRDLLEDNVAYNHDGTDTLSDDITVEVQVIGNSFHFVPELKQKYRFILPIQIVPKNDPPILRLPPNGEIQVVQNSKIQILNTMLTTDDPDTDDENLIYHVEYQSGSKCFFEKSDNPNVQIESFSQHDINTRKIWLVQRGSSMTFIRMYVTDESSKSRVADLLIRAEKLRLSIIANTGIYLPIGSHCLITSKNLSTITNVPRQNLEIRYQIIKGPEYGQIQRRKHENNAWVPVTTFAQRHIDTGHIRYFNKAFNSTPKADFFKFTVTSQNAQTNTKTFIIKFVDVQVNVITNKKLILRYTMSKIISTKYLDVSLNTQRIPPREIFFTLLRPPSFGNLYRAKPDTSTSVLKKLTPLQREGSFTLAELRGNMIHYNLKRQSYSGLNDFIDMRLSVKGVLPRRLRFHVEYIPNETDVRYINNGLEGVIEGKMKAITRADLYIETDKHREFQYIVFKTPQHGKLCLIDPHSKEILNSNIESFTNREIREEQLVYQHDNSEHDTDSFTFSATPIIIGTKGTQEELSDFSGHFDIKILMSNDNAPRRLIDKPFHITLNGERALSINDLAFNDPDIDFDNSQLQYTLTDVSDRLLLRASDRSYVYQFSQQDLIDKTLLVKNTGIPLDHFSFVVTDGQFKTRAILEIEASGPFVKILNNTGISVMNGSSSVITSSNLSVETNVNVKDKEIIFLTVVGPFYGQLMINDQKVESFTLEDIYNNVVKYVHNGTSKLDDYFRFAVEAGPSETQGLFSILLFLESRRHPPHVVHNKIVVINEGKSVVITNSYLHISHPDSFPADIVYHVISPPKYGFLSIAGTAYTDQNNITFTQDDINEGKLKYVHQEIQKNVETNTDGFVFDVTNGFQKLHSLEFVIDILPKVLPLQLSNVSVAEGQRQLLSDENIRIRGKHFEDKLVVYTITEQPEFGWLESITNKGKPITEFTSQELQDELIYYVHDDSETSHDHLFIAGELKNDGRKSHVKKLYIKVDPVNDQLPRVTINKGMQVWNQSVTLLTGEYLKATDPDSDEEDLIFLITEPNNGYLAMLNNTSKELASFTQDMVSQNLIAFVHTGGPNSSFHFKVSDGSNFDVERVFKITAQPLLLTLDVNKELEVYPNTMQVLTSENLYANTNNPNQTNSIKYLLVTYPIYGQIVSEMNEQLIEVWHFTQDDINNGRIFYRHNLQVNGWSQHDFFKFRVETLYAQHIEATLNISISFGNLNKENKKHLINLSPLEVLEGGTAVLTKDNINVDKYVHQLENVGKHVYVEYEISEPPRYGKVLLDRNLLLPGVKFSQQDINKERLMYVHNGNETLQDSFRFLLKVKIHDAKNKPLDISSRTLENEFNITIWPVDDQHFVLVTKNPRIQVIQGLTANITRKDLETTDPDIPPENITYTMITPPRNGMLCFHNNYFTPIKMFTQRDINTGRVLFLHDGSKNTGTFYFKVSDGKFEPFFKEFHIYVTPVIINIVKYSDIEVLQSQSAAYISTNNFKIRTNGIAENVRYNITRAPQYGHLYLKDVIVTQFSQTDLENRLLLYIQTNMASGSDYFLVRMYFPQIDSRVYDARFNITVRPLLKQHPFNAVAGARNSIDTSVLDASELADVTNDNPQFNIIDPPLYGQLVKRSPIRRREIRRRTVIKSFTHEDVARGDIFYEADWSSHNHTVTDSFSFKLVAMNVQPARGNFEIRIHPHGSKYRSKSTTYFHEPLFPRSTSASAAIKPDDGTGTQEDIPNISSDLLIVGIVVSFILIIIIIVLIIFILLRKRKQKSPTENVRSARTRPRPQISGPVHLEQPHVHIEPQQQSTANSPVSDEDAALMLEHASTSGINTIPVINVNSSTAGDSGASSTVTTATTADVITSMTIATTEDRLPSTSGSDRQPQPSSSSIGSHPSIITSHERAAMQTPVPRSPDISRVEVSSTVPSCKVTPLLRKENPSPPDAQSPDGSIKSGAGADFFNFDWTLLDPELLQHCRTTNPVLRDNQYWV